MHQRLDVSTVLSDSWELFKRDAAALIVGGIIAAAIPFVIVMAGYFIFLIPMVIGGASENETLAVLGVVLGFVLFFALMVAAMIVAVPLYAGLIRMVVRRVREGRPAEIGDVFSCFDQLGRLVWAALVLGFIIGVAMIIIIPGVYLAVIWVYAIPLIVDRRMSLGEAMTASKRLVDAQGFWNTFVVLLVLGLIAMVVSFVPFSQVVVYPWLIAAVLAMYFVAAGEGSLLPSAVVASVRAPGVTAPPPAGPEGAPPGANPMPAPPLPASPATPGAPSPSAPDEANGPPVS